jgi:hypothetical protein
MSALAERRAAPVERKKSSRADEPGRAAPLQLVRQIQREAERLMVRLSAPSAGAHEALLDKAAVTAASQKVAEALAKEGSVSPLRTLRVVVDNLPLPPRKARTSEHSRIGRSRSALVSSRQLVPSGEICRRLNITRQALNKALQSQRVFALDIGGEAHYPAFYADHRLDRRHIESVTKALGNIPGWSKWQFFTTPKGSLSKRTPLDALSHGQLDQVRAAARAFAER